MLSTDFKITIRIQEFEHDVL